MWKPCLDALRAGAALSPLLVESVVADVVAIDMPMVFNRLGAQNVNWQMYALRHDLVARTPRLRDGNGWEWHVPARDVRGYGASTAWTVVEIAAHEPLAPTAPQVNIGRPLEALR